MKFERDVSALESHAVKWWPLALREEVAASAPSLVLRSTHIDFLDLIGNSPRNPGQFRKHLETSSLSLNLVIKHLQVLTDFAGEPLKRIHRERAQVFGGMSGFTISYDGLEEVVDLPTFVNMKGVVDNKRLRVDGPALVSQVIASPLMIEVASLLCFGAFAKNPTIADRFAKCDVASWFSDRESLVEYSLGRYLEVNRSVSGAQSNSLGQLLQKEVAASLESRLPNSYAVTINGSNNGESGVITSDLLITYGTRSVGIEVAFQETTNSVIERKGSDAHKRKLELNKLGVAAAYVIDGVGNFERRSAVSKLCNNSDCTVAYSDAEFDILAEFIREWCEGSSLR